MAKINLAASREMALKAIRERREDFVKSVDKRGAPIEVDATDAGKLERRLNEVLGEDMPKKSAPSVEKQIAEAGSNRTRLANLAFRLGKENNPNGAIKAIDTLRAICETPEQRQYYRNFLLSDTEDERLRDYIQQTYSE